MVKRFTSNRHYYSRSAIRYRDEPWRFVAACIAAVATGLAAYPRELQGESAVPHFLALVAVYFFIAYVALLWMRTCTVLLDRRFPWPHFPSSRLAFQLFFCWLMPVLLVYALARSVLSLPQLAALARGNADSRETAAVLVLSLTLSCNIAYVSVYFIALCKRLQRKAQQGLRMVLKNREQQRIYETEIAELRQALWKRDGGDTTHNPAREVKTVTQKKMRILPDNPAGGQYRHVTSLRTELIDYRDIYAFELVEGAVFIHRADMDNEPVRERSLTAIEDVTEGYFRKIGRNRAVAHHLVKRCVQRGTQLELTLEPDGAVVMVSADYARQIEGWILSRISMERET